MWRRTGVKLGVGLVKACLLLSIDSPPHYNGLQYGAWQDLSGKDLPQISRTITDMHTNGVAVTMLATGMLQYSRIVPYAFKKRELLGAWLLHLVGSHPGCPASPTVPLQAWCASRAEPWLPPWLPACLHAALPAPIWCSAGTWEPSHTPPCLATCTESEQCNSGKKKKKKNGYTCGRSWREPQHETKGNGGKKRKKTAKKKGYASGRLWREPLQENRGSPGAAETITKQTDNMSACCRDNPSILCSTMVCITTVSIESVPEIASNHMWQSLMSVCAGRRRQTSQCQGGGFSKIPELSLHPFL